jgi:hypothetical protein
VEWSGVVVVFREAAERSALGVGGRDEDLTGLDEMAGCAFGVRWN